MPELAKWRPGVVDEIWKRRVVQDNRARAVQTLNGLGYILFGSTIPGAGPVDFEAQCDALRTLSCDDIVDQLQRYWRVTNTELDASASIEKTDAN